MNAVVHDVVDIATTTADDDDDDDDDDKGEDVNEATTGIALTAAEAVDVVCTAETPATTLSCGFYKKMIISKQKK